MTYLMGAVGLTLLLIGGDVLVRGAVSLAESLSIPPLVIGLTVVAFGTSAPELVVSLNAVLAGVPKLAIGNIVGSNIANVLLVLGLPALIFPIACAEVGVRRDAMFMIGVSAAFIILCWTGEIRLWQGLIMVVMLAGYLIWSYRDARKKSRNGNVDLDLDEIGPATQDWRVAAMYIVGGFAGLIAGSELLVDGAVTIARGYKISDEVIGLTLVAIGTSLPELATSMIAAIRRHGEVAIGNVVGSNLFNILAIMGITAMVKPVPVPAQFLHFDLWIMLAAAVAIAPFALRCRPIGRITGVVFLFAYLAYLLTLFNGHGGMAEHLKIAF